MTRIEAFRALFGTNADATASQEAIDTLGDNPAPSKEEEEKLSLNGVDTDVLDNAMDFAKNPESEANKKAPGPAKNLLLTYAERLASSNASAVNISTAPASLAQSATSTTGRGAAINPLAGLIGENSSSATTTNERNTSSSRADDTSGGSKDSQESKRVRRDDRRSQSGSGTAHDSPRTTVQASSNRPGSYITPEWRELMRTCASHWNPLRDQLIAAVLNARSVDPAIAHQGRLTLDGLREFIECMRLGQAGWKVRSLMDVVDCLLNDLRNELDLTDEIEFNARYNAWW